MLDKLLTNVPDDMDKVQELIREQNSVRSSLLSGNLYWRWMHELAHELPDYMKNKLADSILIDLGCDVVRTIPSSATIAKDWGCKVFIGVDIGFPYKDVGIMDNLVDRRCRTHQARLKLRPMEVILVKADVLEFVSRLRSECCNFVINGIDEAVLNHHSEYAERLANEMVRATRPNGLIFGDQSLSLDILSRHEKLSTKLVEKKLSWAISCQRLFEKNI